MLVERRSAEPTTGDAPVDLGVSGLEQDPVGGHSSAGVQDHIQSSYQQAWGDRRTQFSTVLGPDWQNDTF